MFEISDIKNLSDKLSTKGELRHLYLGITKACNLRCFYCYDEDYRSKKEDTLTLDEIQKIADDCKSLNLTCVAITGGEPFINKNWFEIGKMFFDIGTIVTYSTNGTLLTTEAMEKLSSINAGLQISLDGDDDMMEFVSTRKQVYSKILKVADELTEHHIDFMFNCVVGKHNLNIIDNFMETINNKGIRCRMTFFNECFNPNNAKYALSINEKYNFILKVDSFNKERNTKNIFMSLPPLMSTEYVPMYIHPACGWAYDNAGILSNGDVTVCAPASGIEFFRAGNVRDSSFGEIWRNSSLFSKLREYDASDLKGICAICPVKKICMGCCRVSPYAKNQDETDSLPLCQEFYDAVMNNEIDTDTFPIGSVRIER